MILAKAIRRFRGRNQRVLHRTICGAARAARGATPVDSSNIDLPMMKTPTILPKNIFSNAGQQHSGTIANARSKT
jgi:hypothetical protein